MPRRQPVHARRRGRVSQAQIPGLAPEAWSGQSNRNNYFNVPSKCVMRFIIQHWAICNSTLTITRLQHFCKPRLVTPDLFLMRGLRLGTRLTNWGMIHLLLFLSSVFLHTTLLTLLLQPLAQEMSMRWAEGMNQQVGKNMNGVAPRSDCTCVYSHQVER